MGTSFGNFIFFYNEQLLYFISLKFIIDLNNGKPRQSHKFAEEFRVLGRHGGHSAAGGGLGGAVGGAERGLGGAWAEQGRGQAAAQRLRRQEALLAK